ncbi:MAG: hypothetical protein GX455_16200 [Phycisphaerae bacterium]|nr:hypothetical protein [Phycisphaerae bacterium]
MKTKQIEGYRIPAYPTQQEVLQNPKLMRRSLSAPVRRLLETGVSGAIALLVPLSGCDRDTGGQAGPPPTEQIEGQGSNTESSPAAKKTSYKGFLVASIFEHGEGRGATGCIVTAPPVFLTEEEGLSVIKEELSAKGLELMDKKIVFKKIPMHQDSWRSSEGSKYLETDLSNDNEQVIIEFVSVDDYYDLGGQMSGSTAQSFDFLKVSRQLRDALRKKAGRGVYGVFYDPMVRIDYSKMSQETPDGQVWKSWEQRRLEAKTEAKDLLRKQVQDFSQWLRDQKVI